MYGLLFNFEFLHNLCSNLIIAHMWNFNLSSWAFYGLIEASKIRDTQTYSFEFDILKSPDYDDAWLIQAQFNFKNDSC